LLGSAVSTVSTCFSISLDLEAKREAVRTTTRNAITTINQA